MEDIRIERAAPEKYPGARVSLKKLAQLLESTRGFWRPKEGREITGEEAFAMGILRLFRTDILNQELPRDITDMYLQTARQKIGAARFDKALDMARQGCFSKNTAEVTAVADAIVALLSEPPPPSQGGRDGEPQPEESKDPSDASDNGESGQAGGESDGEPDEQDGDGGQGADGGESGAEDGPEGGSEDGPKGESKDDAKGNADGEGKDGADGEEGDGKGDGSEADGEAGGTQKGANGQPDDSAAADSTDSGAGAGSGRGEWRVDPDAEVEVDVPDLSDLLKGVVDTSADQSLRIATPYTDPVQEEINRILEGRKIVAVEGANPIITRLRGRLQEALVAMRDGEDDAYSEQGRLATERLARAAVGMERQPFVVDGNPGRELATDLVVLFDESGSMARLDRDFLRQCVLAIGTSLSYFAPDVRFSLLFFTDGAAVAHPGHRRWTRAVGNAVAGAYEPTGGTRWPAAAGFALGEFAIRSPRRKILLTITDGDLGTPQARSVVFESAKQADVELAFVSVAAPLPGDVHGRVCPLIQADFAEAVAAAILESTAPQYR